MKEHHLEVARTARYVTLGTATGATHVWYALHGYGQLASTFLGYLATLESGNRLIVAPEGLSRFYLEQGRGPIGATWMTREDRENEIADYVRYLDRVSAAVQATVPAEARSYLLGFSQGAATAGRWAERGTARHRGICFWAGSLPAELNGATAASALGGRKVALVAGHRDEYLTSDWLEVESRKLEPHAGEVRRFPFHGGHRLDRTVLAEVAAWFESDRT